MRVLKGKGEGRRGYIEMATLPNILVYNGQNTRHSMVQDVESALVPKSFISICQATQSYNELLRLTQVCNGLV